MPVNSAFPCFLSGRYNLTPIATVKITVGSFFFNSHYYTLKAKLKE